MCSHQPMHRWSQHHDSRVQMSTSECPDTPDVLCPRSGVVLGLIKSGACMHEAAASMSYGRSQTGKTTCLMRPWVGNAQTGSSWAER